MVFRWRERRSGERVQRWAGDLLATGPPVRPLAPGDHVRIEIAGLGALEFEVRLEEDAGGPSGCSAEAGT